MKKSLLFAALAVTVAAACTKTNQVPQETIDNGEAVPVRLAVSSPRTIEVKSTGAATGQWSGQKLNIYSYEAGVADYSTATAFIDNVGATAPTSELTGAITLTNPDTNEPFFYAAGKYYDFFGYYIDDAATAVPTVAADGVYVPFTINGSQDLMIATSDKAADIAAAAASLTEDKVYSAYAARRGVQPKLVFKHQLARFTFEIVAGAESGNLINVDGISIESVASGDLKVVGADRGLANLASDKVEFFLQEKTAEGTLQALTPVKPLPYDVSAPKTNVKSVGESLMVVPGASSYRLKVYTSQDNTQSQIDPQVWNLNINNIQGAPEGAAAFEAGYSYKVTIVVYGLEEVKISVELEEWKDGGSTVLDPDIL